MGLKMILASTSRDETAFGSSNLYLGTANDAWTRNKQQLNIASTEMTASGNKLRA